MEQQNNAAVIARISEVLKASAAPLPSTIELDLGDGDIFTLKDRDISEGKGDPDCTIATSREDFWALIEGRMDITPALVRRRLHVTGNLNAARAFRTIILAARPG